MRSVGILFIGLSLFFSSCKNFDGVVGRTGEGYTHRYNYPGSRIAPYNDPYLEQPENPAKIDSCTGKTSPDGFSCE